MGISPETLLHGSMEKDFYTQALAGSKLNNQSLNWTDKEIQEHQFVVEFIKDKIKENGIQVNIKTPLSNVKVPIT